MAPRKRKAPKAKAVVEVNEQENQDHNAVPRELQELIEDLDKRVNEKTDYLTELAAELTQALRCVFQLQLLKLPRQVRQMSLSEFKEKHGGSVESVLLGNLESQVETRIEAALPAGNSEALNDTQVPMETASTARGGYAQTPAVGSYATSTQQATAMRAPKFGETFYSQNGSPVGVLEARQGARGGLLRTVLKGGATTETPMVFPGAQASSMPSILCGKRAGSKTGVAEGITIPLRDGGETVVTFDGGLEGVPLKHRAEAAAHLQALERLARLALSSQPQ